MALLHPAGDSQEALLESQAKLRTLHKISVAGFVFFTATLLFTVVEIRRGIFLPASEYLKIGSPSAVLYVSLIHVPFLVLGVGGALVAFRYLVKLEKALRGSGVDFKSDVKLVGVVVFALLILDLLTYRVVPASRIAAAGKLGIGEAIPPSIFPPLFRPLWSGINYTALVWHATAIGLLLGGLFLTIAASFLKSRLRGEGFKAHVTGVALAIPQPFCSCCAAPVGCTLYRGGASLGPTLAFVVSAPMLNITSLILATSLLPPNYAAARIISGIIVGVLLTYITARIASGWALDEERVGKPSKLVEVSSKIIDAYARPFKLEGFLEDRVIDSPSTFISAWLGMAWRLAKLVVPIFFVASVATAALVMALPSPANDILGVVIASMLGTLLMIPTWTEIPIALGLLSSGATGPAAAMLITLPAVSIPCLAILGGGLGSSKVPLLLGLMVFAFGIMLGLVFLAA